MLLKYIEPNGVTEIENLKENARSQIPTAVFGVSNSFKYFLAPLLFDRFIYIVKDALSAKKAMEEMGALTGKKVVYLPAKDDVLLYNKSINKENAYQRLNALYEISNGAEIVVATMESLIQLVPEKIDAVTLKVANDYPLDTVLTKLVNMGYSRKEFVENKGDFALRGDILEIFPINSDAAVRCDFFGDELEKIRLYDSYSQKVGDEIRSFTFITARDFVIKDEKIPLIKKRLEESFRRFGRSEAALKAQAIKNEIKEYLDTDKTNDALSFVMPLTDYAKNGVFDYVGDVAVVFDECKLVADNLDFIEKEHTERVMSLAKAGQAFDFTFEQCFDKAKILKLINGRLNFSLQTLTTLVPLFKPLKTERISVGAISRYALRLDDFFNDVKNWQKLGYKTVIFTGNGERASKFSHTLALNNVASTLTEKPENAAGVYISSGYFSNGFIMHEAKLVVVGVNDLFNATKDKKIKVRKSEKFQAPDVGDYAVHETYGIGIVRGTKRITTTEGTKDYVSVEYAGGDYLYVPVEDIDKITKYLGGEKAPKLSRLGSGDFEKIKERVRRSVSEMSINLKKLYRDRANKKGFCFSPDNELVREFDAAFEYEETEDQLQSINEIKKDMQSDKVMDRLLCGDVGFGKTEVAFRAAFRAIMDGKQVALVAPTTILTEQHYRTALDRFKDFGVRIVLLNRFVPPKKAKRITEDINSGDVDFIIGTHKLFSKEIKFKDLGLLVLDEEQCFGVEHKEKLRVLKNNVDTLTMTATPIPRTLHMSLSGIRDISIINTPPKTRIPVQAYVVEESDALIRDAVVRELSRDGQVFILYNRVESIYSFAAHIKEFLPEAKIVVAHGQMDKRALEDNIMAFYDGKYNVLVSTTIIENGIDLPSANTLIVIDADKMGLFTLYQLKGRVGRSDKMAHAYFTYKQDKVLTDVAFKRLSALMEYTELGSGYKIAMRDLEIRGAGNVLGREQHGHMDKIGYELYSRILKEQLGEMTKEYEVELDVRMDAFIPNDYIEVSASRLDCYKAVSEIKDEAEAERVLKQIEFNYGKAPAELKNLIGIALLKAYLKGIKAFKATIGKNVASIEFADISFVKENVVEALSDFKNRACLAFEKNPRISFTPEKEQAETLKTLLDFAKKANLKN
ncbi:MAG: transcription-repair coupling factor [Christensenellaceae bacterium]